MHIGDLFKVSFEKKICQVKLILLFIDTVASTLPLNVSYFTSQSLYIFFKNSVTCYKYESKISHHWKCYSERLKRILLDACWLDLSFFRNQMITLSEIAFSDKFNISFSTCFYALIKNFKIIEYICGIFLYIWCTIIKLWFISCNNIQNFCLFIYLYVCAANLNHNLIDLDTIFSRILIWVLANN